MHRLEKMWLFQIESFPTFFCVIFREKLSAGRQCDSSGLCLVSGNAKLAPWLLQIPSSRGLHCLYGSVQPMHDAHSESAAKRNFRSFTSCLLNGLFTQLGQVQLLLQFPQGLSS